MSKLKRTICLTIAMVLALSVFSFSYADNTKVQKDKPTKHESRKNENRPALSDPFELMVSDSVDSAAVVAEVGHQGKTHMVK